MRFEFDREKSAINKQKHGIRLEEAIQLWQKAYLELRAKTVDEPRYMAIGQIHGKLYACIDTMRGDAVRLISCRRAREQEEQLYHDYFKEIPRETEAHGGGV